MRSEHEPQHRLFPSVTDPVIRTQSSGHFSLGVAIGAEVLALAYAESHPTYAYIFAVLGIAHFVMAGSNFAQARRLRKRKD